MPAGVVESFQVAGLTHLLAVSGTNLTLVVGFVLVLARWAGVRARGLVVVGALGVLGFVLLARPEPSVVRAAAMGSVALVGMGTNGRDRGVRALGVAVLVLLLLDPWLALSLGFVLSALATAGILLLAPPWRDALMRWLPRWLAEAVAVPLAAQERSARRWWPRSPTRSAWWRWSRTWRSRPLVGPATVLGLVGGLVMLVVDPVGLLLGRLAGGCAWWIVTVADRSARLPTAAVEWSATAGSLVLLSLLCVAAALVLPRMLARRGWSVAGALVMVLVVVRPLPTPGWPPDGWVMVACDVGQGDGLVLRGRRGHRGGGRRGTGAGPDRPVPGPAGRGTGAGGGADPLPRRPRRGPARGAGGPGGGRGPGDRAPRPGAGRCVGGHLGVGLRCPDPGAGVRRGKPGRGGSPGRWWGPHARSAARVRRGGLTGQQRQRDPARGDARDPDPAHRRPRAGGPGGCSTGRRRTCGSTCSRCRTTAVATRTRRCSPVSVRGSR